VLTKRKYIFSPKCRRHYPAIVYLGSTPCGIHLKCSTYVVAGFFTCGRSGAHYSRIGNTFVGNTFYEILLKYGLLMDSDKKCREKVCQCSYKNHKQNENIKKKVLTNAKFSFYQSAEGVIQLKFIKAVH